MPSPNYDQVFELVRTLELDELRHLRNLIDTLLEDPKWLGKTQDQLTPLDKMDLAMLKAGTMSRPPRAPTEAELKAMREWKPIEIQGKPLSETIIEERR